MAIDRFRAIDPFSFLWPIKKHGHKWIQSRAYKNECDDNDNSPKGEPEWMLTEDVAIGEIHYMRRYAPLEEATGLFRIFAELPQQDRDAIVRFVDEYGRLGIPKVHDGDIEHRGGQFLMPVTGETWAGLETRSHRDAAGCRDLGHVPHKKRGGPVKAHSVASTQG